MKSLISVLALYSSLSFAAPSGDHILICAVEQFDAKTVSLVCNPKKPKIKMTTPREWLEPQNLKVGGKVKFILDDAQFEQWLVMNPSPKAKELAK